MRVGRLPIGLIVPALLFGLVGLLATLQYQWLGKVSEAEREQLRRSLSQHAREFADDFDREISRAYLTLQLSQRAITARDWTTFANAFDRWHATARYPQMIRAVYLAEPAGDRHSLRAYDRGARTFADSPLASWPAHLEQVRAQIEGHQTESHRLTGGQGQIVAITMMPVNAAVPALMIPVSNPLAGQGLVPAKTADRSSLTATVWLPVSGAFVVVDLDGTYVSRTVLPALAALHFPGHGADEYRISVVAGTGPPLFARGVSAGGSIDPSRADVVEPFFAVRPDLARDVMASLGSDTFQLRTFTSSTGAGPVPRAPTAEGRMAVIVEQHATGAGGIRSGTPTAAGQFRIMRPGWRVVLQHVAGSLDAAVSQVRRRNLALSFGILTVLVAGVVLVVVNARRSEQLAARQMDFVATVSHELRTPLAVIRSAAQNLSAGVITEPAQARRYGDLIEGEGRRLTDMVEQVLEYAGIGGNRRIRPTVPIDVAALVTDVMTSCRESIDQAGFAVDISTTDEGREVPRVLGDEDALRRCLHNLVANALKYGGDGRWLGVTVRAAAGRAGQEVRMSVSDRGRGIDGTELVHLFEPFYRGRYAIERQIHGSGLGLSLVKRIVESHGGRVTVASVPGEGSTFTLHLPAAMAMPADQPLGDSVPQAGSPV